MTTIAAFTILEYGHVFPFVPILHELEALGHDVEIVVFQKSSGWCPPHIDGIRLTNIYAAPDREGAVATRHRDGRDPNRLDVELEDFAAYVEPTAEALESFLARRDLDFLLIDPNLAGGVVAAEASGLRWAVLAVNPTNFRARGADVRGPGLPPPRGLAEQIRYKVIEHYRRSRADRHHLPVVNASRRARGLPELRHFWDVYTRPPLTIVTSGEPFEYPRSDWDPSVRFVGPMLWEPMGDAPPWVEELGDRPLVLLAGSSVKWTGSVSAWTNLVLDALAEEPYQVIATLPVDAKPERVPANARIVDYLPHALVLPRATCVVCHGGAGITQKALAAGVPVVAIPVGYDRFEVARRVEVAEAGVMLPAQLLTAERVRAAVRRAMGRKAGAQRVANGFRQHGGAPAAARAIEHLLRTAGAGLNGLRVP